MKISCPACGQRNPTHALFCWECGVEIDSAGAVPRRRSGMGWASLLVVVAVMMAAAFIHDDGRRAPLDSSIGERTMERDFELGKEKGGALYDLLAPTEVRSLVVSRRRTGVRVAGTPPAMEALKRFVELVTRLDGLSRRDVESNMSRFKKTWDTKRTYELPRHMCDRLFRILAFDDVPVLVDQHGSSRLEVRAIRFDQRIVGEMVEVLGGS